MLRSSLGAFRVLLESRALPQRALRNGVGQVWRRGLAFSGAPGPARMRRGITPQLQSLGRRVQRPTAFPRPVQPRPSLGPPRRTFHSSRTRRSQQSTPKEEPSQPVSLSARLKKLSREYGWTAVGVYLSLSVLDFPFCFLLVRTLGTDRIAAAEHFVLSNVEAVVPASVKDFWHEYRKSLKDAKVQQTGDEQEGQVGEVVGWGVVEADERNQEEASLATQLALAYAIHKSFIFIRVPLAAAILPKVVKVLRSWGWKIGKRRAVR